MGRNLSIKEVYNTVVVTINKSVTSIPSAQTMELKAFRPALVACSWGGRETTKGQMNSREKWPLYSKSASYLWEGL